MRTVIVGDVEPSLRLLVSATVRSDRCVVIDAVDGDDAWALIRQHRPAVAVLDEKMPKRTGLELARLIRADPELVGTYVILITSGVQESDTRAGREAGADRYITKPFSPR
ncbi:MAG: response regulator [Chloroflexota bacterium]|nr:response regulator [Chloroflexota bacterium]